MAKIRTVRLKEQTIVELDKIVETRIKDAIKNKTFDVSSLVKRKRGISYDNEIIWLCNFFNTAMNDYNRLPKKNGMILIPHTCVMVLTLKKIGKMNNIC